MVFLQTSCSKEHTNNQTEEAVKKTAPVALTRDHQAVLDFKEQFDYYSAGSSYSYNTLTLEDAEWILEAAFNFRHIITNMNGVDELKISYEQGDDLTASIGDYQGDYTINSANLFSLYADLILQVDSINQMAPASDIEITVTNATTARLTANISYKALPSNVFLHYPIVPIIYDDYHRSFETSSAIKSHHYQGWAPNCEVGVTPSTIWSWQALMVNLRFHKTISFTNSTGMSAYWTNLTPFVYGNDPFAVTYPNSYTGPANQDYSLAIYGANPTLVNSNSFADGHWAQCITKSQMQTFQTSMEDILDDHTINPNTGITALTVKADEASYTSPAISISKWTHHEYEFTRGTKVQL